MNKKKIITICLAASLLSPIGTFAQSTDNTNNISYLYLKEKQANGLTLEETLEAYKNNDYSFARSDLGVRNNIFNDYKVKATTGDLVTNDTEEIKNSMSDDLNSLSLKELRDKTTDLLKDLKVRINYEVDELNKDELIPLIIKLIDMQEVRDREESKHEIVIEDEEEVSKSDKKDGKAKDLKENIKEDTKTDQQEKTTENKLEKKASSSKSNNKEVKTNESFNWDNFSFKEQDNKKAQPAPAIENNPQTNASMKDFINNTGFQEDNKLQQKDGSKAPENNQNNPQANIDNFSFDSLKEENLPSVFESPKLESTEPRQTLQIALGKEENPKWIDTGIVVSQNNDNSILGNTKAALSVISKMTDLKKVDGKKDNALVLYKGQFKEITSNFDIENLLNIQIKAQDSRMGGKFNLADYLEMNGNLVVVVNGKKINLQEDPEVDNSRVLLPLRQIAESMGIKIDWNQEKQVATINDNIVYDMLNNSVSKNGQVYKLSANPKLNKNKRILTVLNFIVHEFQYTMEWNAQDMQLEIKKPGLDNSTSNNGQIPLLPELNNNHNNDIDYSKNSEPAQTEGKLFYEQEVERVGEGKDKGEKITRVNDKDIQDFFNEQGQTK